MIAATENPDPRHQSLQITQHDKFYSRLLSKESASANPSFRVYYGGASGAVPFLWESQPGTPKNTITTSTLPPLTPPPSYQFNPKEKNTRKHSPKINCLMHCMLPRLTPKRASLLSSPTQTSLSSPSVSPSGSSGSHPRSRFSRSQSSFNEGSPTSTLAYRLRDGGDGGPSRSYSTVIMKNRLLSIVGSNGSGLGTAA